MPQKGSESVGDQLKPGVIQNFVSSASSQGIKLDPENVTVIMSKSEVPFEIKDNKIILYYNREKFPDRQDFLNLRPDKLTKLEDYHANKTQEYFKKALAEKYKIIPETIDISNGHIKIKNFEPPVSYDKNKSPKDNFENFISSVGSHLKFDISAQSKEDYANIKLAEYLQGSLSSNSPQNPFTVEGKGDKSLKVTYRGLNEKNKAVFTLTSDNLAEPVIFTSNVSKGNFRDETFLKQIRGYKFNLIKKDDTAKGAPYQNSPNEIDQRRDSLKKAEIPPQKESSSYGSMPSGPKGGLSPEAMAEFERLQKSGYPSVPQQRRATSVEKPYEFMPNPQEARKENPYSQLSHEARQALEENRPKIEALNGEKDMAPERRKTDSISSPQRIIKNAIRLQLDTNSKQEALDKWYDKHQKDIKLTNNLLEISNLPPELGLGENIKLEIKDLGQLRNEVMQKVPHWISAEQGRKIPPVIDLKPEEKLKEKDMATSKPEEFAAMFKDYLKSTGIKNIEVKLGNEGNTIAPGVKETFNIEISSVADKKSKIILQPMLNSSWAENLKDIEMDKSMQDLRASSNKPLNDQKLDSNINNFLEAYSQKEFKKKFYGTELTNTQHNSKTPSLEATDSPRAKEFEKPQEEIYRAPKKPLMGEIAAVKDYFIKRLKEDYNLTINRTYFRQEGNKISIEPIHGYFKAKILYDGNLSPEKMFENFVKESKRKVSLEEHDSLDRRIYIKDGLSNILAMSNHAERQKSLDLLNKISKPVTEEYIAFELRKSLKDPSKQNEAKVLASLLMYSRGEDISPDGIRIDNQSQILANGRYVKFLNQTGELNEAVRQSASRTPPKKPEVIEKANLSEGEYVKRIQAVYSSKIQQADLSLDTTPEHITVTKTAEGVYRVIVDTNLKGPISFTHKLDTDVNSKIKDFKKFYNSSAPKSPKVEKSHSSGMTATVRSSIKSGGSLQGTVEVGGHARIWGEVYFPSSNKAPQIGSPENLGKEAPKKPLVPNLPAPHPAAPTPALKAGETARSTSSLSNYDDEVLRFIRSSLVEPQEKYLKKLSETQKQIKEKKAALAEAKEPKTKEALEKEIKGLNEEEKRLHEYRRKFEQETYSGLSNPKTFPNTTFVPIKWAVADKDGIMVSTIKNPNTNQDAVTLRYKTGVGYLEGKGTARQLTEMPEVKSGPVHLSLVLQNSKGQATPASEALYFTAHMDKGDKGNVVHEVTYPKPARTDSVENLDFDTLISKQFTDKELNEVVYLDRDPTASLPVNLKTLQEFEIKKAITKGIIKDKSYEQVMADIYGDKDFVGVGKEKPAPQREPDARAETGKKANTFPPKVQKGVEKVQKELGRKRSHSVSEMELKKGGSAAEILLENAMKPKSSSLPSTPDPQRRASSPDFRQVKKIGNKFTQKGKKPGMHLD